MAKDMDRVTTGTARPIQPAGPDWAPEPQIITPVRSTNVEGWEWAQQLKPPYVSDTVQEKWVKIITPLRAPALFWLWITWHWTRFAALCVILALVYILIVSR